MLHSPHSLTIKMKGAIFLTALTAISAFNAGMRSPAMKLRSLRMAGSDEYTVAILGDLHLDPRYLDDQEQGGKIR